MGTLEALADKMVERWTYCTLQCLPFNEPIIRSVVRDYERLHPGLTDCVGECQHVQSTRVNHGHTIQCCACGATNYHGEGWRPS